MLDQLKDEKDYTWLINCTRFGFNPLHMAAYSGRSLECLQVLMKMFNPNTKTEKPEILGGQVYDEGSTPLEIAKKSKKNNFLIIEFLSEVTDDT